MPSHLLAVVASMVTLGAVLPAAAAPDADAVSTGAIRTDRLTKKQLKTWDRIVEVVMQADEQGQPLHPTLRGLFDAVDGSGHAVYVELLSDKESSIAGRFEVTTVDPEGAAHEARLMLNLPAIDRISTAPAAARADGFIPFLGLRKQHRYAELLGHELAHAAHHLADVELASLAQRLHRENEALMQQLLGADSQAEREQLVEQARGFEQIGRQMEVPAETAEAQIWEELSAGS